MLVVSGFDSHRPVTVGPLDRVVVDLSSPIAYLNMSVEGSTGDANMLFYPLKGGDPSLQIGISDRVVTSIKLFKLAIDILRCGSRVKAIAI